MAMPRTMARVVCTLCVTIDTLAPTELVDQRRLAGIGRADQGDEARAGRKEHMRDEQAEHPVAQELESLIVGAGILRACAAMCQRALQALVIDKQMPGDRRQGQCHCITGQSRRRHHRTMLKKRVGLISVGHFQSSSGLTPPAIEKKMMLARPTRFSSGTKPTWKRLSLELSRLSPIMK
jgi:hypothetical protein